MSKLRTATGYHLLLVSIVAACAEQASVPLAPLASSAVSEPTQLQMADGLEESFRSISGLYPEFAGFFIENGRLVVRSLDPRALNASQMSALARNALLPGGTRGPIDRHRAAQQIEIRQADYSFLQLDEWRAVIREEVMGIPGLVSFDLDEAANRLSFGLEPAGDRGALASLLRSVGIPAAATRVRVEAARNSAQGNLNSRLRPLTAGYRFGRYRWNAQLFPIGWVAINYCTLGVPAVRQQVQVLLIVSHCTPVEGGLDGTTEFIGQDWTLSFNGSTLPYPITPPGYGPFGTEVFDRVGWTCGPLWDRRPCRHSEVAAWNLNGIEVLAGETPFVLGRIARPEFAVPGTATAGSTVNINLAQPHFTIVGEVVDPVQGDPVHKVGVTTGWTYGNVTATCEDVNYQTPGTGVKRRAMCQSRATLGGQPGDSGSPVFLMGNEASGIVYFYGLVHTVGGGTTSFSSVRQLRGELGPFQVF